MQTKVKLQAVLAIFATTLFWGSLWYKVLLDSLLPEQIASSH